MRKELCHHTMSVRARTAAGFRARAAKSDTGSLLPETLPNKPYTIALAPVLSVVSSVKTRSSQDTIWSRHDLSRHVSRCLLPSHTPSQDQQTTADEGTFHYVTFCSDRVRGAHTCRHPCSAFSSNRARGSNTGCHLHSALFSDRVRGSRTCCLLCRTSASD